MWVHFNNNQIFYRYKIVSDNLYYSLNLICTIGIASCTRLLFTVGQNYHHTVDKCNCPLQQWVTLSYSVLQLQIHKMWQTFIKTEVVKLAENVSGSPEGVYWLYLTAPCIGCARTYWNGLLHTGMCKWGQTDDLVKMVVSELTIWC